MTDTPALSIPGLPVPRASALPAGEQRRLQECAAEPLRTIDRVQSHGILFGVDPETSLVVAASDNADRWLGRPLDEAGDTLAWAVGHGVAIDPVRVEFEGTTYDAIVHRGAVPMIVELEPVIPDLQYVRTGVVAAIQRLAAVTDPDELRVQAAAELKMITGFDRVMVYRFHDDGHGQVVADAREPDMEPYLGLHFPASDIPVQARALYVEKRSRVIADTEDPGTPIQTLVPDNPLDLGPTELRSASVHHLQFMRNMGQASTVSFALVDDDRLVGMITCAHRTPRRLPVLLRRSIEVLASQLALQIASADHISELRRRLSARERRAAITAPLYGRAPVVDVLLRGEITVLDLVPADGAVLRIDGRVHTLGSVADADGLGALLDELDPEGFVTESLRLDRPDLAADFPGVAGLVVVPLSAGDRLAFVRREVAQTVEWLGDQTPANRAHELSPRRSFSAWSESVTGRSLPWGDHARDAFELGDDVRAAIAARAQAELAELALRDALTGLRNRRYLDERLDELLGRSAGPIAVIFIDLDDFKLVNDTHGHDVGDAVLAAVGERLSGAARTSDIVARLGGDEFVMVCVDVDDPRSVAERALHALAQPIAIDGVVLTVSASAGVVASRDPGDDEGPVTASELLAAADAAMYRAKRGGGGRASA